MTRVLKAQSDLQLQSEAEFTNQSSRSKPNILVNVFKITTAKYLAKALTLYLAQL